MSDLIKPTSAELESGEKASYTYAGKSPQEVSSMLEAFFSAKGYKKESGDDLSGTYGKGSDLMRMLLGAFHKRFKFAYEITGGENTTLVFKKVGSGIAGGIIGINQVDNEFKNIKHALAA